jgi:FkbM family methyltransferase
VRPGSRAVDVGANLGVFTYALWRLGCQVEAFEPVPEYAAGIRAFDARRIQVHQVALSAGSGDAQLQFPREGGVVDLGRGSLSPPHVLRDQIAVPVKALDHYGFSDISFIKIDVEGHELDVLQGAAETIKRCRPNLLVEIEQRHLTFPMTRVFQHLADLGYRGSFIEAGVLRSLSEFSYERHQQPWLHDVYAPEYVNNFVFAS